MHFCLPLISVLIIHFQVECFDESEANKAFKEVSGFNHLKK